MEIEKRQIGNSDLRVPGLGIGTDSWGEQLLGYGKKYQRDDLYQTFRACLDMGLNFFDTAEGYGRGESERLLGEFKRQDGRPVILATKFDNSSVFSPNRERSSPRSILTAIDGSLKRLQMERIDLYQVHFPLSAKVMDEYMEVLATAVRAGKIRAVGVSNFNAALMRQAHASLARRSVPLVSNQVAYNLLQRYPETNGVLEACRELKVSLIACIPLALGILTGKYRKGETHLTLFQKMFYRMGELDFFKERQDPKPWLQRIFAKPHALQFGKLEPMFRAMEEIGQAHGKSIVQVGLNWLMAGDEWVIPIPGAKSVQQAQGNAGALGWRLSPEEHERISRAEAAARHGVQ